MEVDIIRAMNMHPVVQSYDQKDAILFALGLGYGDDPLDEADLRFVYEQNLQCVPAYANVLCHPGFWVQKPEFGIDWVRLLHAEQHLTIHKALPPTGTLRGKYRVASIEDKGAARGALLHQEKELYDAVTSDHLATVRSTLFLRGNGGEGGFGEPPVPALPLPDREPDRTVEIATLPRQALIYRLSGDWNPLHADPQIARRAGFDRLILHGLCTMGLATRAILSAYCANDVDRFRSIFVRFSAPVMPGEAIRFEFFEEDGHRLRFRAIALDRGAVVLDRCSASVG